jgi:hypothetical protein
MMAALPVSVKAQTNSGDTVLQDATLEKVIQYAISHQPLVQQSIIDEAITDQVIKTNYPTGFPS